MRRLSRRGRFHGSKFGHIGEICARGFGGQK